jgi:hypothetical protein
MKHLPRSRPSPALVIACIALALSLGGVGYAALRLPVNSVGTKQVINHSLLKADFKPGQLPRGPRGVQGPKGDTGAGGAAGVQGLPGPKGDTGAGGAAGAQGLQGLPGPKGDTGPKGDQGPGAIRIDYDAPKDPAESKTTILKMDELTVRALCADTGSGGVFLQTFASSTVPSEINYSVMQRENLGPVSTDANGLTPDTFDTQILQNAAPTTVGFERWEGEFVYRNANRVISVVFHAIENANPGRCQVQGTATPSPN